MKPNVLNLVCHTTCANELPFSLIQWRKSWKMIALHNDQNINFGTFKAQCCGFIGSPNDGLCYPPTIFQVLTVEWEQSPCSQPPLEWRINFLFSSWNVGKVALVMEIGKFLDRGSPRTFTRNSLTASCKHIIHVFCLLVCNRNACHSCIYGRNKQWNHMTIRFSLHICATCS